jgi:hypothetical protein
MTTEEFISSKGWGKPQYIMVGGKDVQKALIEFAKLHVEAALKEASEKAKTKSRKKTYKASSGVEYDYVISVDKNSILNAYPLNQIK